MEWTDCLYGIRLDRAKYLEIQRDERGSSPGVTWDTLSWYVPTRSTGAGLGLAAAHRHNPRCKLYVVTGEFAPNRLEKMLMNCPPAHANPTLAATVHFAPALIRDGLGEDGRMQHPNSLVSACIGRLPVFVACLTRRSEHVKGGVDRARGTRSSWGCDRETAAMAEDRCAVRVDARMPVSPDGWSLLCAQEDRSGSDLVRVENSR